MYNTKPKTENKEKETETETDITQKKWSGNSPWSQSNVLQCVICI